MYDTVYGSKPLMVAPVFIRYYAFSSTWMALNSECYYKWTSCILMSTWASRLIGYIHFILCEKYVLMVEELFITKLFIRIIVAATCSWSKEHQSFCFLFGGKNVVVHWVDTLSPYINSIHCTLPDKIVKTHDTIELNWSDCLLDLIKYICTQNTNKKETL